MASGMLDRLPPFSGLCPDFSPLPSMSQVTSSGRFAHRNPRTSPPMSQVTSSGRFAQRNQLAAPHPALAAGRQRVADGRGHAVRSDTGTVNRNSRSGAGGCDDDVASVRSSQAPGDRQPDATPGAGRCPAAGPIEPFEDAVDLVGGDARTFVDHVRRTPTSADGRSEPSPSHRPGNGRAHFPAGSTTPASGDRRHHEPGAVRAGRRRRRPGRHRRTRTVGAAVRPHRRRRCRGRDRPVDLERALVGTRQQCEVVHDPLAGATPRRRAPRTPRPTVRSPRRSAPRSGHGSP